MEKFQTLIEAKNFTKLRTELHRVRGGLLYLSLPQLHYAFQQFHEVIKSDQNNSQKIKESYADLLGAMNAFLNFMSENGY